MSTTKKECRNCIKYEAPGNIGEAGQCRAEPPKVFLIPVQTRAGQMATGYQSSFPPVNPDQWCHGWQPKSVQ